MGGIGSGGWNLKRITVESCLVLDVDHLVREGAFRPGTTTAGTITWSNSETGAMRAQLGYTANMEGPRQGYLRLRYRLAGAGIEREEMADFIAEPCPLGGLRWAVECPIRRSLARKLYLPPGGRRFASRLAYGLTYRSRHGSAQERPMRQAQALRARLGGDLNLDAPYPDKPLWMRWKTYNRYIARLEQLEVAANARLAIFVERLMT